jgi:excinuclease UvrABC nuclease subunit
MRKHPDAGIYVERSRDFYIVNLHPDQLNASSHSKNLKGSTFSTYSDLTKLFQRIRDESHRFAVSYHTVLKRQKQTASMLEEIPGIGPATRKALIKKLGSLRAVEDASEEQLAEVVGLKKAQTLMKFLKKAS